ncbi:hypothetical protein [Thomasclavelia cocleata]|uniref:hypothetical protein n=1 Tax=Thomasclavelia cocleata TaxID=69824 RepID=UPI001558C697|nr:hypothetical protein [Thomasclavelia cocleata]
MLLFFQEDQIKKEKDVYYGKMEQEVETFVKEKKQLETDLLDLEKKYDNEINGKASVELLFTDLNENIYTDIYPWMKEYGYIGTLAISPKSFPGQKDCLSMKQFEELINAGWQCCLKWDKSSDINEWLSSCRELAKALEIKLVNAVYFPTGSYNSKYDEILMKEGILVVVYHDENDLLSINSKFKNDLWYSSALAWNSNQATSILSNLMNQKGNMVYIIGSESIYEKYEEGNFIAMLKRLKSFSEKNSILVYNLLEAREYCKEIENKRESIENNYKPQKEVLESKIAELDKKIDSVYDKYIK